MSAIICENTNDLSIPTYYYYVVDNNTASSIILKRDEQKYLVKDKETSDEILSELHEIIEDSCNKYKIVLYILLQDTADKENDFIERFNTYIKNITGIYYFNITIFSYINKQTYDWLLTTTGTRNLKTLAKYFLGNHIFNHKKMFKVYNVYAFDVETDLLKVGETKIISYKGYHRERLEDNVPQFNLLKIPVSNIDNYGINYLAYTFVPKIHCHIGSLRQITGTCWFNSIMNALLLPEISKKIMLQNLKLHQSGKDRLPVTQLLAKRNEINIQNMLSSVIYNMYVKKIKLPNKNTFNFMNVLASRMKHLINGEQEKEREKSDQEWLNYGEWLFPNRTYEVIKYIIEHYTPSYSKNYEIVKYESDDRIDKSRGNKSLVSCIISVPGHVVCGFICGTKEYIYDANVTSQFFEDNWTSLHFDHFSNERLNRYIDTQTKKFESKIFKAEFLKSEFLQDNKETKIKSLIEWWRSLHLNKFSYEVLQEHILQTKFLETQFIDDVSFIKEWEKYLNFNNFSNEMLQRYIEQTKFLESKIFKDENLITKERNINDLTHWYLYKNNDNNIAPKIKFLIYCRDPKKRKLISTDVNNQSNATKKRRVNDKECELTASTNYHSKPTTKKHHIGNKNCKKTSKKRNLTIERKLNLIRFNRRKRYLEKKLNNY